MENENTSSLVNDSQDSHLSNDLRKRTNFNIKYPKHKLAILDRPVWEPYF